MLINNCCDFSQTPKCSKTLFFSPFNINDHGNNCDENMLENRYICFHQKLTGTHSWRYGKYILPLLSTNIDTLIDISGVGFT